MAFGKLLSLYYVSCAVAWNVPGHDATEAPASPARRDFLLPTAPVVAAAAAAIAGASQLLLMSPPAAGAVTPSTETAAKQWESAAKTIDGLLDRWDTTYAKGGGDAIRAELGTQGTCRHPFTKQSDNAKTKKEWGSTILSHSSLSL